MAAIPNAPHRDEEWKYHWEVTDQNGKFMLRGISPGVYKVFSWDAIEDLYWYDPQVMKPYEDKAGAVGVKEGDQKSVELTVMETKQAPQANP